MKIAIIGSGIAGNVVAHGLHRAHDITVYEAASHVGGHTHTHSVDQWRLLSSIEAANGIIMFGWSTSLLMLVLHRMRPKIRLGDLKHGKIFKDTL